METGSRSVLHLSQRERSDLASDPGEGTWSIDRPYPLTPALSPWERGQIEFAVIAIAYPQRALPSHEVRPCIR